MSSFAVKTSSQLQTSTQHSQNISSITNLYANQTSVNVPASNPITSFLRNVDAELSEIAVNLRQAEVDIQRFEAIKTDLYNIRSNIQVSLNGKFISVDIASLDKLLRTPEQALSTAYTLRQIADLLENASRQSTSNISIQRTKDLLSAHCARLDALQMKKIDSLVLGNNSSADLLEMRKSSSARVANLVEDAHRLYQKATELIQLETSNTTAVNLSKPTESNSAKTSVASNISFPSFIE